LVRRAGFAPARLRMKAEAPNYQNTPREQTTSFLGLPAIEPTDEIESSWRQYKSRWSP
jgi:hypothetical protein